MLAENGMLPRDRRDLYGQIMRQLLGQRDSKRDVHSLDQAIGGEYRTSQELRNPVMDRLCYKASICT